MPVHLPSVYQFKIDTQKLVKIRNKFLFLRLIVGDCWKVDIDEYLINSKLVKSKVYWR